VYQKLLVRLFKLKQKNQGADLPSTFSSCQPQLPIHPALSARRFLYEAQANSGLYSSIVVDE
jgi:hypothetical protein